MDRRTFCRSLLMGAGSIMLSPLINAEPSSRPNILLITADDLGPQLGCYGDPIAQTPNIDNLSNEGVRFERAFVTQTSCSPSRSSMFTGLYPHQNGQIGLAHLGYSMHQNQQTLPALLKQLNYRTGVVGKIHVAPTRDFPFDYRETKTTATRDVQLVSRLAEEFLNQSSDVPFFLMVNYLDPHRELIDQVNDIPKHPVDPDDIEPFGFLGLDTPEIRKEVAGYYNAVKRVDVGVGLLMDVLTKSGHADDTLVIFIGDHGPPFTRAKTTCYEAGLHVPFVVRWSGHARKNLVRKELISTVDILPTVLDAVGVQSPEHIAGKSFVGLLEGKNLQWRDTLCAEYTTHGPNGYYPRRSIRDERFKLILNLLPDRPNPIKGIDGCLAWATAQNPSLKGKHIQTVYNTYHHPPAVELYDLEKDPNEFYNLAEKMENAQIQSRLSGQLQAWRKQTNDPLLDPENLLALTKQHDKRKSQKSSARKKQ